MTVSRTPSSHTHDPTDTMSVGPLCRHGRRRETRVSRIAQGPTDALSAPPPDRREGRREKPLSPTAQGGPTVTTSERPLCRPGERGGTLASRLRRRPSTSPPRPRPAPRTTVLAAVLFLGLTVLTGLRVTPAFPATADQDDIHALAGQGDHRRLLPLLRRFPDAVRWPDPLGREPLHLAVQGGSQSMVEFLVQHGANVDAVDGLHRRTPLHEAARLGFPGIAKFLLARGAQLVLPDRQGNTPLHLAARAGKPDLVTILLQHGAAIDPANMWDRTPLHEAVLLGQEDDDPAAAAGQQPYLEAASRLVAAGASLSARDAQGDTVLTLAIAHRCPRRFCDWLRSRGATP
ncbi:MAG: ankyrin repeat domain-containing protein [Candidatus Riflebacteria bacterium]|nr:ankyrin repeat domain-containing protein [Candidatus Riflebacteria bacterium]